ncbi:hypothetical protein TQ32_03755 [Pyrococcus kukulkanii]|uniref:Uncharacterized protein n=1 Tax=Pyrococcus kukulkanii TaxID=1609559 RepID=A0A127B8J7_9EURY|nr:hypothetical protein TQ32_03755 [Pyrococcus kukulkanii]
MGNIITSLGILYDLRYFLWNLIKLLQLYAKIMHVDKPGENGVGGFGIFLKLIVRNPYKI